MQQTQRAKIRVLIGDTSVRSRLVLTGMIDAELQLEVVDTARSREELLSKAITFKPDVIVAHYGLTNSGSLPFFKSVYSEESEMLLMVSQEWAGGNFFQPRTFQVFGGKATPIDAVKPGKKELLQSGLMSKLRELAVKNDSPAVFRKAYVEATEEVGLFVPTYSRKRPAFFDTPLCLVVIGASTGGSQAIEYLVSRLSAMPTAVVLIAVHMPEKFTKRLARRLQKQTSWRVTEGYQGMKLSAGTVVVAPGGHNMQVKNNALYPNQLFIDLEPSLTMDTPSVDALMQSAAQCSNAQVMGVIMTGMGQDGTAGSLEIVKHGGVVIAQDEETSTIFGMAKSAIENGSVHGVFALSQINSIIHRFVADRSRSYLLQRKMKG